jgi:hypothetical protein
MKRARVKNIEQWRSVRGDSRAKRGLSSAGVSHGVVNIIAIQG